MLAPRKVKYRKTQRGRIHGLACRKISLSFGSFGLKAEEAGLLSARQIETARRTITRFVQRGGKIWCRIFPDKPITKKGSEVGMGGGKGAVDHYVAAVKPGTVLFEMDGVTKEVAKEALTLAIYKLPIKCRFIAKEELR